MVVNSRATYSHESPSGALKYVQGSGKALRPHFEPHLVAVTFTSMNCVHTSEPMVQTVQLGLGYNFHQSMSYIAFFWNHIAMTQRIEEEEWRYALQMWSWCTRKMGHSSKDVKAKYWRKMVIVQIRSVMKCKSIKGAVHHHVMSLINWDRVLDLVNRPLEWYVLQLYIHLGILVNSMQMSILNLAS